MGPFSAVGSFQSSKSSSCCYRQLPTTVANYVEFMCTVVALCGLWPDVQATPFNMDQLLQDAQDAFRRSSWYIFNISIVCSFISWAGLAAQSEISAQKAANTREICWKICVCLRSLICACWSLSSALSSRTWTSQETRTTTRCNPVAPNQLQ